MRVFLFLSFVFILPHFLFAQETTNIVISTKGNNILVQYDLIRVKSDLYKINLQYSLDGGENYSNNLEKVTGDIGTNIEPGKDKTIKWNVLEEQEELIGEIITFRVTVERPDVRNFVLPAPITCVGIGVGVGVLSTGLVMERDAKKKYNLYKDNISFSRNGNIYEGYDSREALYHEANDQHNKARILTFVGGVVVLSGIWMIMRLKRNKKNINEFKKDILGEDNTSAILSPSVEWFVNEQNHLMPRLNLSLNF